MKNEDSLSKDKRVLKCLEFYEYYQKAEKDLPNDALVSYSQIFQCYKQDQKQDASQFKDKDTFVRYFLGELSLLEQYGIIQRSGNKRFTSIKIPDFGKTILSNSDLLKKFITPSKFATVESYTRAEVANVWDSLFKNPLVTNFDILGVNNNVFLTYLLSKTTGGQHQNLELIDFRILFFDIKNFFSEFGLNEFQDWKEKYSLISFHEEDVNEVYQQTKDCMTLLGLIKDRYRDHLECKWIKKIPFWSFFFNHI